MKKILIITLLILLMLPSTALADELKSMIQIHEDATIKEHEVLSGDVVTVLGDITVDGKVLGDAVAILGDIKINGTVMGDVIVVGGSVIRSDTSKIYGEVTQLGIGRGIEHMLGGFFNFQPKLNLTRSRINIFSAIRFLGLVAISALCIILFPDNVKLAAKTVDIQPGRKLLIGFVALLLMPVVIILLIITLLGIPLVPLVILLISVAGFFGYIGISIFLGRKLNEQLNLKPSIFLEYLLGAILLRLLDFVPVVGIISSLIVMMLSIGLTAETRFGTKK